MSHNVTIEGAEIENLDVLETALNELKKEEGFEATLVRSTDTFRGWVGRLEKSDAVIKLPGYKYDIGLVKNANGSYSPRYEDMAYNDFGKVLGAESHAKDFKGDTISNRGGALIGRLRQRMNVIAAEREAALNGHTTTREVNKETGMISVIAEVS